MNVNRLQCEKDIHMCVFNNKKKIYVLKSDMKWAIPE